MKGERTKIDKIDAEILRLLKSRLALAKKIGAKKAIRSMAIFDPAREAKIFERLKKRSKGTIPDAVLRAVFGEIISASRGMENSGGIAFLGPEATFTHAAAIKKFGSTSKLVAKGSIRDVFDAVEKGGFDCGVVPVENSSEGSVTNTLDMLIDSDLRIIGEAVLDVRHHLLSKYKIYEIRKVYSHSQAIAQCRDWLEANLPRVEVIETTSTAKAAELASIYLHSAAIASELAAKKYGLKIIVQNIHDVPRNFTRFFIIGRARPKRTGRDKTSVLFSVKHESGALFRALKPLQKNNINMTKIESRPAGNKPWEYVFFADLQGYADDRKVRQVLREMGKSCIFMRILGSYPEESES